MIDLLKYRFSRDNKYQTAIEDVYDGVLYKSLVNLVASYQTRATFPFLGTRSVWPVYLVINESTPLFRWVFFIEQD